MSQLLEELEQSSEVKKLKLLNLGCGQNFHSDWVNLDIVPCSPKVQRYDLRKQLKFPDHHFDACYSSHVLEHLKLHDSVKLLEEAFRVLKPRGVIRIVVPDLEGIARIYLNELERAEQGIQEAEDNYDWIILELLDQLVRSDKNGLMGQYICQIEQIKNRPFVMSRLGDEFDYFKHPEPRTFLTRLARTRPAQVIQKARHILAGTAVNVIAGREAQIAFEEGIFRSSGEVHRWMYDRFSLKRLLKQVGFTDLKVCCANESAIPEFNRYNLDISKGKVIKPDSLFVEGYKP